MKKLLLYAFYGAATFCADYPSSCSFNHWLQEHPQQESWETVDWKKIFKQEQPQKHPDPDKKNPADKIGEVLSTYKFKYINAQDHLGFTSLIKAAEKGDMQSCEILLGSTYAGLKSYGYIDTQTYKGFTALHLAARGGHVDCVRLLLKEGAKVNIKDHAEQVTRDSQHCTALHLAASGGNVECVRLLVQSGAYVNETTSIGSTALHLATYHGKVDCVRFLLKAGANVNQQNNLRCTPLNYAYFYNNHAMIQLLLDAGGQAHEENCCCDCNITPLARCSVCRLSCILL